MKNNPRTTVLASDRLQFRKISLLAAVVASTIFAPSAQAGTATWNSGSGNTWSTGANWSGGTGTGGIAGSADDVIFDNRSVAIPGTIALQGNQAANSLTFGSASGSALGAFTLQASTGTTAESLAITTGNITVASQVTGTIVLGNSTNGALTLTTTAGGFTVANNSSQVLNIGAIISGATKTLSLNSGGGGTIILSGANTATGADTIGNISAGTLVQLNSVSALSTFASNTISSGSAVDINGKALSSTAFTLNGAGIGSGVNAGALVNSTGTASDAGAIILGSASTIKNSGTLLTLTGTINNGGFLLTVDGGGNTTFGSSATTGVISGAGGLAMVGSGTLTLTGDSTFSGGLAINNGSVILAASNSGTVSGAAGPSTSAITLGTTGGSNSASLLGTGVTVSNNINLGTTSGTLTIGNTGNNSPTYSGAISLGGHNLVISSTGTGATTTLSGGVSGTGTVTIINGASTSATTISTGGINNAGQIVNNGTGNGTTTISGTIGSSVTGIVQNSATSALSLSGTNSTFTGPVILNQGSLNLSGSGSAAGTGTITIGSTGSASAFLNFTSTGLTFANNINLASGATGTLVISNSGVSSTMSGTLNLNGSNVNFTSSGLGNTGKTVTGTIIGTGTITIANSGTGYTFNGSNGPSYTTLSGLVNNAGLIYNVGTGNGSTTLNGTLGANVTGLVQNSVATGVNANSNLVLNGNDTAFGGTIKVVAGTLSLGSATALGGNGSTTGTGGALTISTGASLAGNATITTVNAENWLGNFSVINSNANLNMGTGAISLTNGALTLSVGNAGSTFTVGGTISDTALGNNAVFDITKAGAGGFTNSANVALTANRTANLILGTESLTGTISGTNFGITTTGPGTLVLGGVNTFTGALNILNGSTLSVATMSLSGTAGSLGQATSAAANIVINNGTLNYSGGTSGGVTTDHLFTIGTGGATFTETGGRNVNYSGTGALAFTGSGARSITLGAAGTNSNDNNSFFDPLIGDGTGGATTLVKNSAGGRWTLNGTSNNTYSGGTQVYGGVLAAASGNPTQVFGTGNVYALGSGEVQLSGTTNLASGAKVILTGGNQNYATVAFGFDATDAQISSIVDSSSTNGVISIFSDTITTTTNALNMANYGDGTLYLGVGGISTNNNAVTFTYGASSLGVGAGNVYRLGGGTSVNANTLVIGNNILANNSGANTLVIGAPGSNNIVKFTANQSITGSTTINNGSVVLSGSFGALSGSAITVNSSPTLANAVTLTFDDSTAGVTGNTRAAGVTLNGNASLLVNGNTGANVTDTITGTLGIGSGASGQDTVTLTPGNTKNTLLTAGSFSRSAGSIVLFRGTALGVNSIASQTGTATNISFTSAPTLTGGGGSVGSTTHGIIVGAFGDTNAAGTGASTGGLVTYDATNGVRLLQAGEYQNAITDGQSTLNDVLYATTAAALTTNLTATNTTINSLSLSETGTSQTTQAITISGNAGTTLNISSGVIYANQSITGANSSAGAQLISVPTLNFGSKEGVIFNGNTAGTSNGFFSGGLNISSVITGTNGLTIGGNGYVELSGSNTYSGTTTVNGGKLVLGKTATVPGNLVLNGGSIMATVNGGLSSATNFTINGGTYTGQNGNGGSAATETITSLTMNGGIYSNGSGGHGGGTVLSGSLTMNGGTYNLSQSGNIQVGGLATFSGGVLNIGVSDNFVYDSYIKLAGGWTINNTGAGSYTPITLTSAGASYGNGSMVYIDGTTTNGGNVIFNGNSTNSNTVSISAPVSGVGPQAVIALNGLVDFTVNNGAAPIDLTLAATIIEGANTSISGGTQGALEKDGLGTLLLSGGPNTYTGGTILNAGTLALTGSATLGTTNMSSFPNGLTVTGGTLDMGGTSQVVDSVSITGPSTIQNGSLTSADPGAPSYYIGNSTGTVNISANLLDSGISGGVPLYMSGTGTLILSGTNTYVGPTTISAGTVLVSGSTAAGSAVALNGGTLKVSGTVAGTVAVASGATLGGTGTTGAVTVAGGGNVNLSDGLIGTLTVGGFTSGGGTPSSLTFEIGTGGTSFIDKLQVNGALSLSGTTYITIANLGGVGQTLTLGSYNLLSYTGALTGTLGNFALQTTSLDGKLLSLTSLASGQLILTVANNVTSTTYTLTANAGATVLHAGGTTSVTNTITNTGTGTADSLNYTGLGVTTSSGTLNDTPSSGGPVVNNGGTGTNTGTFTAGSTGTTVVVGPTVSSVTGTTSTASLTGTTNASIVVYTGQGVWNTAGSGSWGTASASQTAWTAAGGTPGLDAGFTNTDSATFGTVGGNNSATVSLNGSNPSLNAITFSTSGGGYTLAQGSSGSFTLSNSGSLSAAITDSGTNSASNTISAPIVLASNLNATITDASDTLTISGTVSGSKSVTKNGAGKLILSGANTYTNGTTVNTGTLVVGTSTTVTGSTIQSGAVGTGTLTLASGSTLQDNGTAITLANAVSASGTITFSSTGAGSLTFDGRNLTSPSVFTLTGNTILVVNNTTTIDDNIAGNFTLTKQGNGTLNLLGTSSSTAGTTITSGSITIANGASLGSGLISLANGTGLTYTGGAGTLAQNITVASGATGTVSNTGTATLTLAGTLTKADANLILNAGGHTIDVTGAIVSTGATGTFDSDLYATNGTIIADNSNNSYSGPTHIYGNGTLVNGFNNALPTSTVVELGNSGGAATETGAAYTNIYQLNGHNQSIAGLTSANPAGFTDSNHVIGGSATLSTLTLTGTASLGEGILGGTGSNANNLAVKFNPGSGKTITLSGSNTYTGGTEVVDGNLLVNNTTGSATGGGTFKLDSGAGLSGTGTITSTSNTINGNVTVGSGGTNTTDVLTMTASGTTTFSGANLTFNLDANSTNSNVMALGSTPSIYFGSGVTTLTLNLLGTGSTNIANGTDYILFTASSASDYKDLTFSGSKITNFVLTLTGTASNGAANSLYYGQSYLILSGNNIEIQVVPEPGTWALMLGGLALLVAFQRIRRSRNS